MRHVSLFGSTGSIGTSTLDIIQQHPDTFCVDVLVAHKNVKKLAEQAIKTRAQKVVISDETLYKDLKKALSGTSIQPLSGEKGLQEVTSMTVDIAVSAISGVSGLYSTFSVLPHAKTLVLANKESVVAAGPLLLSEAKKWGTRILPADSEHSAIFQVLNENHHKFLEKITLTASGGPFRTLSKSEFDSITVEQALCHPNWDMGTKITIDSATLANKGLELIEASYLFDVPESKIDVIVHPQSIIHSMVSFHDGSSLAQLGVPDMKTPLSYALGWPERISTSVPQLDLASLQMLTFEKPDYERFPCLSLARQSLQTGPAAVICFNAANEVAVDLFTQKKLKFTQIPELISDCLHAFSEKNILCFDDVISFNQEALRLTKHIFERKNKI